MTAYALIRKTDHVERGRRRLIDRFKVGASPGAILASYLAQLQKAEDLLWEVHDYALDLESDLDCVLDAIGVIVGRGRQGLSNDAYRIALRVQILINRSSGTPIELRNILELAYPEGTWTIHVRPPASFFVVIQEALTPEQAQVLETSIAQVRPLGVSMLFVYGHTAEEDQFRFDQGGIGGRGLGWSGDPSIGGRLSHGKLLG